MNNKWHSLSNKIYTCLEVALIAFLIGLSSSVQAAKTLTKKQITEVQKSEAQKTKKIDKSYKNQAKAKSQHYTNLAQKLSKSGADVQPLLSAAAYFDSESKK